MNANQERERRFAKIVLNRPLRRGEHIAIDDATSRYEILELLGEGGSGRVFRAFDNVLGMDVAIKILAPRLVRDAEALKSLKAEVRINLGLIHKHILRIYNLEKSGQNYLIIMELLKGKTVFELLKNAPQGFEQNFAVQLVSVAADAMGHAHRHGVLHLDLTPSNIFLTDDGIVKIIDFGIAKLMGVGSRSNDYLVGTPAYMSPEQLRGDALDGRSDIYTLGIVAGQLLTGRKPQSPPSPPEGLPPAIASVLAKATAQEREERFGAIEDFAAALREACG